MSNANAPVPLAGVPLTRSRAFFHADEQQSRVLMPFIFDGVARGDLAARIVNSALRGMHPAQLAGAGIDAAASATPAVTAV